MKPKVVNIRERPPLPGRALEMVQRSQTIPTPSGPRDLFVRPEFDVSLHEGNIVVRKGGWMAGFSSVGCHWLFVVEQ